MAVLVRPFAHIATEAPRVIHRVPRATLPLKDRSGDAVASSDPSLVLFVEQERGLLYRNEAAIGLKAEGPVLGDSCLVRAFV